MFFSERMPRKHKRLLGSRTYCDYTKETLEEALQRVVEGRSTIREASREFKIPFGTLYNKYKGRHGGKPGRPTIFTTAEEVAILKAAAKCADWGFPLSLMDVRMMAKYYLDGRGKTVNIFKNNIPGVDWTYSLLERHKDSYGQRIATNIKRARATVSRVTLAEFYDNLENTLKDLPSSNIFNYDESNLSDDPGKMRGVYRRGVKYPEKVMNHSKSCTTIMICGSADGTLLPPYVIYKSVHLYDSWKDNGPRGPPCCDKPFCSLGTRYNRTASGWMDGGTFRDWFTSSFLPHAKRLEGKKALIGDNLSSHMDAEVLRLCDENEIYFVCLVPHSTHLCQPLDVGFFRPMKEAWRAVLTEWKLQNIRLSTVPKDMFPALLKKCLNKMDTVSARATETNTETNNTSAIKRNLISSFRAAGICPLNRQEVFKRLPPVAEENDPTPAVEDALTTLLREQRFGDSGRPQRKKKRLDIPPGCSMSTVAPSNGDQESDDDQLPLTSVETQDRPDSVTSMAAVEEECNIAQTDIYAVDQYILARFSSRRGKKTYKYVCKIIEVGPEITVIGLKSVRNNKRKFKIIADDISEIKDSDIIKILPDPLEVDEDGHLFYVFETDIEVNEM